MLKGIKFENCQGFVDCEMSFMNGLNVIAADNNVGKSILYKVLKLAGDPNYYSEKDRRDLIRKHCEFALITFSFDDDSYALMRIAKKGTVYAYLETCESDIVCYSEPPIEMIQHLGLLVSADEPLIANLIDMDQGLLLVDPKLRSNYSFIRMISSCEDLDVLRERVNALIPEYRQMSLRAKDSLGFIDKQLEDLEYVDVAKMESLLQRAEAAYSILDKSFMLLEPLTTLDDCRVTSLNFDVLLKLSDVLEKAVSVLAKVSQVPVSVRVLDECLLTLLEKMESVCNELLNFNQVEEKDYSESLTLLTSLEKSKQIINLLTQQKVVKAPEYPEVLIDTLEKALALNQTVHSFKRAVQEAKEAESERSTLEKSFRESGEIFDCPIYGEVVFDGKNCVADS